MDTGHQLAFINQNFLSIANTLSKNSFVVVAQGTASVAGKSTTGAQTTTTAVAHNLGYQPIMLINCTAPAITSTFGGSGLLGLPLVYLNAGGTVILMIQARIDSTSIYIDLVTPLAGTTDLTPYTWTFKYYLLQQTAN